MIKEKTYIINICFFFISPFPIFAQQCNPSISYSTPTKNFVIKKEGKIILDTITGLIWKRCSQGQFWKNNQCQGKTRKYTFYKAKKGAQLEHYANFNDWRIPTIKELVGITELACIKPAINTLIFPNTDISTYYWSISPYANDSNKAWVLDFEYGSSHIFEHQLKYPIRLVRTASLILKFNFFQIREWRHH